LSGTYQNKTVANLVNKLYMKPTDQALEFIEPYQNAFTQEKSL